MSTDTTTYTVPLSLPTKSRSQATSFGPQACRLSTPRPDEYNVVLPPDMPDCLPKVALAIAEQYPHLQERIQPFLAGKDNARKVHKSLVPIHLHVQPGTDITELTAKGLEIGSLTAQVHALHNTLDSITGFIEVSFIGLLDSPDLQAQITKALGNDFELVIMQKGVFAGTKVFTGEVTAMIHVPPTHVTPTSLEQAFEHWSHTFECIVRSNIVFCHFCRHRDHIRKDCTVAPPCSKCTSRAHPSNRCSRKIVKLKPLPELVPDYLETAVKDIQPKVRAGKRLRPNALESSETIDSLPKPSNSSQSSTTQTNKSAARETPMVIRDQGVLFGPPPDCSMDVG